MHASKILIALLIAPTMLLADPDPAPPKPDAEVLRVVTLTNTRANNVMAAIHELGFPTRSTVLDENRLVLRGTAEDVQLVLEQLVAKIDIPAVSPGPASTIDYIQLTQSPSPAFMSLIEAVAPRDFGTQYALDAVGRLIAVNAPKEQVVAIRKLVEAMDRPAESFLVHFYFLRGTVGSTEPGATGEPMPKDLAPIATTLRAAGFAKVELIAPLIVHAVDGMKFKSTLGYPQGSNNPGLNLNISVEGRPVFDKASSSVRLELDVRLAGRVEQKRGETGSAVSFPTLLSADSVVTTKLDSIVILAAAPNPIADGDAHAVAVKVTRASATAP